MHQSCTQTLGGLPYVYGPESGNSYPATPAFEEMAKLMLASMSVLVFLVLSGVLPWASATSFNVVNGCGDSINVQVAENPGKSIGTSGFSLSPGQSMVLNPPDGWGGNLRLGVPSLLAEFSINNQPGTDHYDISAVDGFILNRGMSITGGDVPVECSAASNICPGENVNGNTCVNPNRDDGNTAYAQAVRAACPTVYSWSKDDTKDHGSSTGRTFTIKFCP